MNDLQDFLQSSLKNQTITGVIQTGTLNKSSSTVISIDVDLANGTTLHLAAKTTPVPNPEVPFYNVILPTLRFFQESEDIDELNFIPVSYGGRNLTNGSTVLLEDLKAQRYRNLRSFDLGTTRQILKDLASFHAIPLALKLKDPKVFETKIRRHINRKEEVNTQLIAQLLKTVEEDVDCAPYVDKVKDKFEEIAEKAVRAPFSTMVHNEFFWKNVLVKTGSDGFADIKLIDFQHCNYGSLAEDLILFLYTSVEMDVLEDIDGLIEFYHSNLVRVLEECRCDPTPFSLDALFKELKIVASESQFVNVLMVLFSLKKKGEDVKERMMFAMKDFVERNWV